MIERPFEPETLDTLDRAIESDPCHHFRIGEMLAPSAHFPDALVRERPYLLEMGQKHALEIPCLCQKLKAADTRVVQCIHHLAKDVDL